MPAPPDTSSHDSVSLLHAPARISAKRDHSRRNGTLDLLAQIARETAPMWRSTDPHRAIMWEPWKFRTATPAKEGLATSGPFRRKDAGPCECSCMFPEWLLRFGPCGLGSMPGSPLTGRGTAWASARQIEDCERLARAAGLAGGGALRRRRRERVERQSAARSTSGCWTTCETGAINGRAGLRPRPAAPAAE